MNNREKIITALAGLAAVIGGGMLLLDSGGRTGVPAPTAPPATAAIRQDIAAALPKLSITAEERAGVQALNRPWIVDPFYVRDDKTRTELGKDAPELLFRYTGYLEMGGKRIAIINGQEYQENEQMDIAGYRLRRIYPNRVLIAGDTRDTPIVIPYEEMEGGLEVPLRQPSR